MNFIRARKSNKSFNSNSAKQPSRWSKFMKTGCDETNSEVNLSPTFFKTKCNSQRDEEDFFSSFGPIIKNDESGQELEKSVQTVCCFSKTRPNKNINGAKECFEEIQHFQSKSVQDSNQNCIKFEIEISEKDFNRVIYGENPDSSFDFLKFCYEKGYLTSDRKLDATLFCKKSSQLKEDEVIRPTKEMSTKSGIYLWKNKTYLTKQIYDRVQVRTMRMNAAYNFMMSELSKRSPIDMYTKGMFYRSESSQNYKQSFEFFKINPCIYQMLKWMTKKNKIEFLIVCEGLTREYYQAVCNEFVETGSVSFEKKAKLWNAYWYTYALRDLYVFALWVPLWRIKIDLLTQTSIVKTKFNLESLESMGIWSLKEHDSFAIEGYISDLTKRQIEFHVNQYKKVPVPFDYRFSSLIDNKRRVGIILDTYLKNGRLRDVITGHEFEFYDTDLLYDNIDIIKIEKMMINKKVPVVLFTPLVNWFGRKAEYLMFLGTKQI